MNARDSHPIFHSNFSARYRYIVSFILMMMGKGWIEDTCSPHMFSVWFKDEPEVQRYRNRLGEVYSLVFHNPLTTYFSDLLRAVSHLHEENPVRTKAEALAMTWLASLEPKVVHTGYLKNPWAGYPNTTTAVYKVVPPTRECEFKVEGYSQESGCIYYWGDDPRILQFGPVAHLDGARKFVRVDKRYSYLSVYNYLKAIECGG